MDPNKIMRARIKWGLIKAACAVPAIFGLIVLPVPAFILISLASLILILPVAYHSSIASHAEEYHTALLKNPKISNLAALLQKDEETVIDRLNKMVSKGYIVDCYYNSYTRCVTFYKDKKVNLADGQDLQRKDMLDVILHAIKMIRNRIDRYTDMYRRCVAFLKREVSVTGSDEKDTKAKEISEESIDDKKLVEFRRILGEIKDIGQRIKNKEILKKVGNIDMTLASILDCVIRDPDELHKLDSFINYYLPTTLKLIESYIFCESHPYAGETFQTIKEYIEKTLDKLDDGFKKQHNQLFTDEMLDISASIKTLELIMAKDGLLDDELHRMMSQH